MGITFGLLQIGQNGIERQGSSALQHLLIRRLQTRIVGGYDGARAREKVAPVLRVSLFDVR